MAITANIINRYGTNTGGSGRGPLPLVNSAGDVSTSSHFYTLESSPGKGRGIRIEERKRTAVTYTQATKRLSATNLASLFAWEKTAMGAERDATWTQSGVDPNFWYHNGTGIVRKPTAFRANGTVVQEANWGVGVGSPAVWVWGDFDTIGANRIYYHAIDGYNCNNLVSRNCVFIGFTLHYHSGNGASNARIHNPSTYSGKAASHTFVSDASSGSGGYALIDVVNCAQRANASTAGKFIENNNTFASASGTNLIENCIDWGTITNAYDVITLGAGGFAAGGWPIEAMKSGQLNISASQSKDNNPLFVNEATGDLNLQSGSQCRGVGWPVWSRDIDYLGNPVPQDTPDIGAIQYITPGAAGSAVGGLLLMECGQS